MIFHRKIHRVAVFRLVIGRVTVEKCILPVILPDQALKVLVLNHHIGQSARALPDQMEEAADITWLSGKGLSSSAEAVANQLEVVRCPPDVPPRGTLQQQLPDHLPFRRFQICLGQLQLLLQVIIGKLILGEKFMKHLEIVPGVEREKTQLLQQGHRPVLDTAAQIGQVAVVIVVDLQTPLENRPVKGYRSAPAKHVDEAGIPGRRQLSDQPEELALSSYPGNKGLGNTLSPPSREIVQGLL